METAPDLARGAAAERAVAWRTRAILLLAMLATALLALPTLASRCFWFDECFSVYAARDWQGLLDVFRRYENNMSLYYILLHGWMMVVGSGEYAVRLLSTLAAIATIPVTYALGRRLFDRQVGLLAAWLVAIHPFLLQEAQEARSYSLAMLLSATATWMLICALERPRWWLWLGHGAVLAAAVYAHYYAALVGGAHAAIVLLQRGRPRPPWRMVIAGFLGCGLLLLPLALFPPASTKQLDWLERPGAKDLYALASTLAGGRIALLAGPVCLGGLAWRRWRRPGAEAGPAGPGRGREPWLVLGCAILLPIAVAVAFSLLVKPVFQPKYLVICLVPTVLGLAALAARLPIAVRLPVIAMLTLPVVVAVLVQRKPLGPVEGWRDCARFLQARASPEDAVIVYPFPHAMPLGLYLDRGRASPSPLRPLPFAGGPFHPGAGAAEPAPDYPVLDAIAASHRRVWLVLADTNASDPWLNRTFRAPIVGRLSATMTAGEQADFANLHVRRFDRPAAAR